MNILVVDDEKLIRDVIREYVENEAYTILEAEDGEAALALFQNTKDIDLVVLDIMMPRMDGFQTLKEMRKIRNVPTIMLSARGEEYDKLYGFDLGSDDYVTKPFSPKELMARIKAILKRSQEIGFEDQIVIADLVIDIKGHVVKLEGQELKLTPKEYELLCYFVKNKNMALSREQLLSKIWGYDFFGDDRTIDTHIKMLRNNLGKYRDYIVTVRGMGYKFELKEK